jgi:hypothetical protein
LIASSSNLLSRMIGQAEQVTSRYEEDISNRANLQFTVPSDDYVEVLRGQDRLKFPSKEHLSVTLNRQLHIIMPVQAFHASRAIQDPASWVGTLHRWDPESGEVTSPFYIYRHESVYIGRDMKHWYEKSHGTS